MEVNSVQELKELRKKAGYSQMELAKQIGVTQSNVAKWETGNYYPRPALLPVLADLLHCTIDDLFGREKEENV